MAEAQNGLDRWALYEELVGQHDTLGQKIDFLPLKEKVYRVMVFDAVSYLSESIQPALTSAYSKAQNAITAEYGYPATDQESFENRRAELEALQFEIRDLFNASETANVAQLVLNNVERTAQGLHENFGIKVQLPTDKMENLRRIDTLFKVGDFHADPELMKWADRES